MSFTFGAESNLSDAYKKETVFEYVGISQPLAIPLLSRRKRD